MKKFLTLLLVTVLGLTFTQCEQPPLPNEKDTPTEPNTPNDPTNPNNPNDPTNPTDPNSPNTQDGGGLLKFSVEANGAWTIKRIGNTDRFIKITPSSGNAGVTDIVVEVSKNPEGYTELIEFGQYATLQIIHQYLGAEAYAIQLKNGAKSFYANGFSNSSNSAPTIIDLNVLDNRGQAQMNNPITSIDVSKCPTLAQLSLFYTPSATVNIWSKVTSIDISGTMLTSFDSKPLKGLKTFKALNCKLLKTLNLSSCLELNSISFSATKITSIDLSSYGNLEIIECNNSPDLATVFLSKYQTIKNIKKDEHTVLKYGSEESNPIDPTNPNDPEKPLGALSGTVKFWVEFDAPWEIKRSRNNGSSNPTKDFVRVIPSSGPAGLTEVTVEFYDLENRYMGVGEDISFSYKDSKYGSYVMMQFSFPLISEGTQVNISVGSDKDFSIEGFNLKRFEKWFKVSVGVGSDYPTNVDFSKCPTLTEVFIYEDGLKKSLKSINLSGTNIESFDSHWDGAPHNLRFEYQCLEMLKVDNCPNLKYLCVKGDALKQIDLSRLPKLAELHLESAKSLSSLTLANLPLLSKVYIGDNSLSTIDVSLLPALTELRFKENKFKTLALKNPKLTVLSCEGNLFEHIDLTNLPSLRTFAYVYHRNTKGLPELWVKQGRTMDIHKYDDYYINWDLLYLEDYPNHLIKYK